jgi:ABC-2 type transport system permease protein
MANLGTLIRLEFAKAIRRPMTWILAVIFIGFMGFMYAALTLALFVAEADIEGMEEFDTAFLEDQVLLPEALPFGSTLVVGVGAVIMIVFAAGMFGSEFGWATIRMMLLMRAGRTQLVVAKIVLIIVMSAILTIIGMATVLAGALGAELIVGDPAKVGDHLTADLFSDAFVITLRSIVAIAMWALIGGMLALAFSSMAIGTGVALAGYFVGDLVITLIGQIGTVGEWFVRLMPTYGINGMVALNQISPPDFSNAEIIGMVASMIVWGIAFIGLGLYRFWKMDVIAASS